MRLTRYAVSLGAVLLSGAMLAAPTVAETLDVRNSGFERDALAGPGEQGKSWHFDMQEWSGYRQGIMRPIPEFFANGLPWEGQNVAFLSYAGSWMQQETDAVLLPDSTYTLSALIGTRADGNFAQGGQYKIELFAGSKRLAGIDGRTDGPGNFVKETVVYQSGPNDPAAGQKLKVKFTNVDARQLNIDAISLTLGEEGTEGEEAATSGTTTTTDAGAVPEWETVGLWTYDEVDGMRLGDGLVLLDKPGSGIGHAWQYQLELTSHATLPPRQRILWPVSINRREKQVCVNSPYPSFIAHVDVPGEAYDGTYSFGTCEGGFAPAAGSGG